MGQQKGLSLQQQVVHHFEISFAGMATAQVDGVRSVSLIIRTIATLGNYDYSQDVR